MPATFKRQLDSLRNLWNRHEYWRVFLILFGLAFLAFASQALPNGLTLPVNGDYILQQLHFYVEGYDSFWNFVRTGEFQMWSHQGFLGVNYFAANTFYYLTSPFLLPMFLVPRAFLPHMIYLMMVLKLAVGGFFFYLLLRRYWHVSAQASLIGAIAYSLCGWGMYYLWFNHFSDVLAVFPLTLLGVEHLLQKRRGWLLSLGLFVMGITNYYFLFAFLITTVGYALFRYAIVWKSLQGRRATTLGMGIFHVILGLGMCAVVLVPAIHIVLSTPRVESSSTLMQFLRFFFENPSISDGTFTLGQLKNWASFTTPLNLDRLREFIFVFTPRNVGSMLVSPAETALFPIAQFLFPPVSNWTNLVFSVAPAFDNTVTSIFVSTPLALLLWPAGFRLVKERKWWSVAAFAVVLIMPFIPFTYYLLNAFTMMYGRWQLFLVAMILLAVIPLLDHYEDIPKFHWDVSLLINLTLAMVVVWYSGSIDRIRPGEALLGIAAQIVVILIFYYILREQTDRHNVHQTFRFYVTLELIIAANITMIGQGVADYWTLYGGQHLLREQQQIVNEIQAEDPSFYRIFNSLANRNYNNLALTLGYNGISSFHSIYDFQLNDFINSWSRISYSWYNWSMGVHEKRYNLEGFLNVKYYLLENTDTNVPLHTSLWRQYDHYSVYRNDYFVELGYAFDNVINESWFLGQVGGNDPYFFKESYYNQYAILPDESSATISAALGRPVLSPQLSDPFVTVNPNTSNATLTFYPREDATGAGTTIYSLSGIESALPEERNNTLYGPWVEQGLPGDQIRVQFQNTTRLCPNPEASGGGCHVVVRFNYGPNANLSLYHEGALVASDHHQVNNYDKSGDHKYGRGFYVDQSIDEIRIELLSDAPLSQVTKEALRFYYEPFSAYQARQEALMANAFQNITHTNNTLHFSTNYDSTKMIVLSVPYDEGWSLSINGESTPYYRVTSGFLGFIAPSGEADYSLNYESPGIMTGVKISLGSWGVFALVVSVYALPAIQKRRRKKRIPTVPSSKKPH